MARLSADAIERPPFIQNGIAPTFEDGNADFAAPNATRTLNKDTSSERAWASIAPNVVEIPNAKPTVSQETEKRRKSIGDIAMRASIRAGMLLQEGVGRMFSGVVSAVKSLPRGARPAAVLAVGLAGYVGFERLFGHAGGAEHHMASASDLFAYGGNRGGGGGQHFDQVRLLAEHRTVAASNVHDNVQNATYNTRLTEHTHTTAVNLYNQRGVTVSQDYDNLPGGFHKNWNQMIHDANAARNAGDLRYVYPEGRVNNPNLFWFQVRTGHGWSSNNSDVLRVMAHHSGGHRVYSGTVNGVHVGHSHAFLGSKTSSHETILAPSGESSTVITGDHGVTIINNGHGLRVGLPHNELTPYGRQHFFINTPDGITVHSGHLQIDPSDISRINKGLAHHGLYATYHYDGHGNIDQINIHKLGTGDPTDLQFPSNYELDFNKVDHNLVITLPDGRIATVHVPDTAYDVTTGYIDFDQVEPLIKSALLKDGLDVAFYGYTATITPATGSAPASIPAITKPAKPIIKYKYVNREEGDDVLWGLVGGVVGLVVGAAIMGVGSRRRRDVDRETTVIEDDRGSRRAGLLTRRFLARGRRDPIDPVDPVEPAYTDESNYVVRAREPLFNPGSTTGVAFLDMVRRRELQAELAAESNSTESAHTAIGFAEMLRDEGVVSHRVSDLNQYLDEMGIERGSARYEVDNHHLIIVDDDNGASIRRLASQLSARFGYLPPHDAFLGNSETIADLQALGDDNNGMIGGYFRTQRLSQQRSEAHENIRVRVQQILDRIARDSAGHEQQTIDTLGLNGLVHITTTGGYAFDNSNAVVIARRLTRMRQPVTNATP